MDEALELVEATIALLDCVSMFLKAEEAEIVITSIIEDIPKEKMDMRNTKMRTAQRLIEEVDKLKEVYEALSYNDKKAQALS